METATSGKQNPTLIFETVHGSTAYDLGALKGWQSYQTWLRTRNPKRSELEAKFGYDTKHAMHLVRLQRMAI